MVLHQLWPSGSIAKEPVMVEAKSNRCTGKNGYSARGRAGGVVQFPLAVNWHGVRIPLSTDVSLARTNLQGV
jgi:hypothetical protein